MSYFLERILSHKADSVARAKTLLPFSVLYRMMKEQYSRSRFSGALESGPVVIAEIKKASPSEGIFFTGDRISELGRIYQKHGAAAVSIVTEELFFKGCLNDLHKLQRTVEIPVLRKDFIIDSYQILETKFWGADAVLLIASLLSSEQLREFIELCGELGMDALVEVHDLEELQTALDTVAEIIGINNRNLKTFQVDLDTAKGLLPLIPDSKIKIVESGIKEEKDLETFTNWPINAFLIGEALITAHNPGERLRSFCSALGRP